MENLADMMASDANKALAMQKRVTISIMADKHPSDPREWSNLCTMYITDRHFDNLGDEFIPAFGEVLEDHASVMAYFADRLDAKKSDILIKDLRIHSTGSGDRRMYLNEHTPEASSQGYLVTTKPQAREAYRARALTKKHVEGVYSQMDGEVKDYVAYLNGDVYGYEITCDLTGNIVDSQWGFLGADDPYLNEEIAANIQPHTPPIMYRFKFKPNLIKLRG